MIFQALCYFCVLNKITAKNDIQNDVGTPENPLVDSQGR